MPNRNLDERPAMFRSMADGMVLHMPPSRWGVPEVVPATINPFVTGGSTQLYPLGTQLWYGDRKFAYAKAGASALAVGILYQSVVPLAGRINETIGTAAAEATTIGFTPAVAVTDDVTANEFADGYLHINDVTGEGHMYRIKSHPAITGGTSGTLTLYDPIVVATVSGTSEGTIIHNRFRNVIIHASPQTAMLAGVAVCTVTASDYCWLQVKGPCACLVEGTHVIGDFVVPSATTDGAVMPSAAVETDGPPVGHVMAVNATTEYGAIWLDLPI